MFASIISDPLNLQIMFKILVTISGLVLPWLFIKLFLKDHQSEELSFTAFLAPLISLVILSLSYAVAQKYYPESSVIIIGVNLAIIWLCTTGLKLFSESRKSIWMILLLLIPLFILDYVELLEPTARMLESLSFQIGESTINVLQISKSLFTVLFLIWGSRFLISFVLNYLKGIKNLRSSNRDLLGKIFSVLIYFVIGLVGLNLLGVDLTALTVFGGALGIGLGFGLQKITSNFISGVILLFEKTVEIDDLIELPDGVMGFVRKSSMRYTLIETFDNKEIMVPNEDFITSKVINWTYSDTKGRVEIEIGVSYKSDIHKARDLILEAASEHPECGEDPAPVCFLKDFGDSAVMFTLWYWVNDVTTGRWKPRSEVQFAIWDKFAKHNIEIPFPQRDLNIKSLEDLNEILRAQNKQSKK